MMDDMISRQAAIEAIRRLVIAGWGTDHGVIDSDVVYEALEELPSAQQWIPVSSGELPKHNDLVNVTLHVPDESGDGKFSYTTVGWYLSDGMWIVYNDTMHEANLIRVAAWCPLPKEWKGEEDVRESD